MTDREYNDCVDKHADHVFRFIVKNIRHEEDSRDIVQGAYEKLWVNRRDVEGEKAKSWLFTVAYHSMIDHLRKSGRVQLRDSFEPETASGDQPIAQLRKTLQVALDRLNETQRSLVMLKDYEGYSYEEIGRITGLNASQVKVYLHRARMALRNYLVSPEHII